jgi:hypothetical protein
MTTTERPTPVSDLKIVKVEALSLRLPEVKVQGDSGQDALIVRFETDAGIPHSQSGREFSLATGMGSGG